MSGKAPRYTTVAHRAGVVVVDQETGEVTLIPVDGTGLRVLRPGRDDAAGDPAAHADADAITRAWPLPIARAYARVLAARDPTLRCLAVVECFVTAVRYWALVLASEYAATDLHDVTIDPLLCGRQPKLVSDWVFLFERLLAVLSAPPREPFFDGLREAVEALDRGAERAEPRVRLPGDPAAHGAPGSMSPIKALVSFRNRMAHEPTPRGDRAAELADRHLGILRRVLRETRCVADRPLCARRADGTFLKLMGTSATPLPDDARPSPVLLSDGVFVTRPGGERVVDAAMAFALVDRGDLADGVGLLMFETFDGNDAVYHGTSGEVVHRRLKSDPWRLRFAERPAGVSLKRLGLDELTSALAASTGKRLERWRAREAWLPEQVVETEALRALERFVREPRGDRGALALVSGPRGSGRTTALAWLAQRLRREHPVVLLSCSTFRGAPWEEVTLREIVAGARRGPPLGELFERLEGAGEGARVLLLYDDVDSLGGPAQLDAFVEAVASLARTFPGLRVVASATSPRRDVHDVPLRRFSLHELTEAYRRLQLRTREGEAGVSTQVSAPTTPPEALRYLSAESRRPLEHPRTLRLLAEHFHGAPLPLASLSAAVGRVRVAALADESAGAERHRAVRALADAMVLRRRAHLDAREVEDALRYVPSLPASAEGVNRCLESLLSEGIVARDLRDGERWRFAEATVFDALVVEAQLESVTDPRRLWEFAVAWRESPDLNGALVALMVHLCERGRHELWSDAVDRAEGLEREPTLRAAARCLEALAVGRFDGMGPLLDALLARPTPNDVVAVAEATSRALHAAPRPSLVALGSAFESLERALGADALPLAARLSLVRVLRATDRRDDARAHLERLRATADALPAPLLREVLVEAATLSPPDVAEADRLVAAMGDAPRDAPWASALRTRAALASDAHRWDEARALCERALESSDPRERLRVRLLQRWIDYKDARADEAPGASARSAEALLDEVERFGHLDLLRMASLQCAIERDGRGDYRGAVALAERAVEVGRVAGLHGRAVVSLLNLGVFRIHAGDLAGARAWLREAAELALRGGFHAVASDAMALLAVAERELDDLPEARAWLDRALRCDCAPAERPLGLWIDWCFDPTRERGARWREAVAGAEPDACGLAQQGAVALHDALPSLPLAEAAARFAEVADHLARRRWSVELVDLPLPAAHALAARALREGDRPLAERVVAQATRWVDGRPWGPMRALDALVRGEMEAPRASQPAGVRAEA